MDSPEVLTLPIDDILIDDEFNCRGKLVPADVLDLAEDIKKNGLHQPVVVARHDDSEINKTGKKFRLVAGFRRTYAHKILKLTEVTAVVKPHMDEVSARVLNLSENLKRKDLNILQEAKALKKLWAQGVTEEGVAELVGKSRGWVQTRFKLLELPDDIQEEAAAGLLNQYQIKKLGSIKNRDQLYALVRKIKDAKAKGESADHVISRKKPKPTECKHRKKAEIEAMIDEIMDQIGGNNFTRALAWAAGNISDFDLYKDLKDFNPKFEPPADDPSLYT